MKDKHIYRPVDSPEHILPEALRANPYTVPDGYFTDLRQRTLLQCRLTDGEQQAWGVPPAYFEQLENRIAAKIDEQKLKEVVSEPGFSVPDGYFDSLEEHLLLQWKLDEQANESGFTVEKGYFETLEQRIADQTYRKESAPIRKIGRPTWMAYAAAACIALVAGFFGISTLVNDRPEATGGTLASVSDQEILSYLEFYGTTEDMIYISEHLDDFDAPNIGAGISEEDIEEYLNHTL